MPTVEQAAGRLGELLGEHAATKEQWHALKQQVARELGIALPPDAELARHLDPAQRGRQAAAWRTKPVRSRSGVAVVAVMSSPAACPHGKCTFCPGGPDVGVPQSYTGFEPSTLRAQAAGYDPCRIVRGRLAHLERNGHAIDKVDVVVQGGTFPARDPAYQDWFVAGITQGLNDGPEERPVAWEPEAAWSLLPAAERERRLADLQRANESARCRLVGLTVETKPDWCLEPHVDRMLRLGATRVEVGVQTLDEGVLRATHRGHTLEHTRRAFQVAKDAGFKVVAHLMPGLPRQQKDRLAEAAEDGLALSGLPRTRPERTADLTGFAETAGSAQSAKSAVAPGAGILDPDPEADVEDGRRLFAEPDWRPDMLKVYPTLVVQEGETLLKRQWREGLYHPYDTAQAAAVVARIKRHVPPWCRIQRVDRDIPTTHVEAGVQNSNLRQFVQAELARMQPPAACACLRCREAGHREAAGAGVDASRAMLVRRAYAASGGQELFLSFEDPQADAVLAYLRLRRVGPAAHRPEVRAASGAPDAAFVRELKVPGLAKAIGDGDREEGTFQHQGLGARLLEEAERTAFGEWGVGRLLVIAGPGVKPYYRRHGYTDCGPYVAKDRRTDSPICP